MTGSKESRSNVYVDTSAFVRVMLEEPDKKAIQRDLAGFDQSVASRLLRVELRRVGKREDAIAEADLILDDVLLIPIDESVLATAETIAPTSVGTLDAIHLATAVRLAEAGELDALMTYDKRLADGARTHGITVLSPS
ncbi:MAG TPA: type II toxin-antitoxin system VapC family toxin [Solirubrobacteraceae bacterium]